MSTLFINVENDAQDTVNIISANAVSTTEAASSSNGPSTKFIEQDQDFDKSRVQSASMDVDRSSESVSVAPVAGPSHSEPLYKSFDELYPRASSQPIHPPNNLKTPASTINVGYVWDERMLLHASRTSHPESPNRIIGILSKLRENRLLLNMKKLPIRKAEKMEVLLVHSEDHWEKVQAIYSKFLGEVSSWFYLDEIHPIFLCFS